MSTAQSPTHRLGLLLGDPLGGRLDDAAAPGPTPPPTTTALPPLLAFASVPTALFAAIFAALTLAASASARSMMAARRAAASFAAAFVSAALRASAALAAATSSRVGRFAFGAISDAISDGYANSLFFTMPGSSWLFLQQWSPVIMRNRRLLSWWRCAERTLLPCHGLRRGRVGCTADLLLEREHAHPRRARGQPARRGAARSRSRPSLSPTTGAGPPDESCGRSSSR